MIGNAGNADSDGSISMAMRQLIEESVRGAIHSEKDAENVPTIEKIMGVSNREERQRAIRENMALFRK